MNQHDPQAKTDEVVIPQEEHVSLKRTISGKTLIFVYLVTVLMAIYHIYILAFSPTDPWIFSITHLNFVMVIGFIYYAAHKHFLHSVSILDILLILASLSTYVYVMYHFTELIDRAGVLPEGYDMLFGCLAIITVLELSRRTAGWVLTLLVVVFLIYCVVGPWLPGLLWHKGYSLERIVSYMFSPQGIYNIPLGTTARFVYIFVLFGAFLELSGAAPFFMDFAYAAAGRSRGGPAKVAIISSGLLGMVNGTSTGNVVTTGTLTIPLMKRTGYSPSLAGAVEACASTGGQIMPPVMGAAVFLMAQMINMPYTEIMVAATLPALLYYVALYMSVDLEAGRIRLMGVSRDKLPPWKNIRRKAYLSLPVFVLLYCLLIMQASVVFSGLVALVSAIGIGIVERRLSSGSMFTMKEWCETIKDGGMNVIQITATCAAAGMIMGALTLTGLGLKIASIVVSLSGGNLFVCLVLTMLLTILLGMGLPTIAAYAIPASVVVPALVDMGVPELAAHMFVLYYASLSAITPPVALASFAAAAIAHSNPLKVSCVSVRLGIAGFIIPYMFVYGPQLLLVGDPLSIAQACITAIVGVIALSIAIIGYLKTSVSHAERALYVACAMLLIKPGFITDIAGCGLLVALILWNVRKSRQARTDGEKVQA